MWFDRPVSIQNDRLPLCLLLNPICNATSAQVKYSLIKTNTIVLNPAIGRIFIKFETKILKCLALNSLEPNIEGSCSKSNWIVKAKTIVSLHRITEHKVVDFVDNYKAAILLVKVEARVVRYLISCTGHCPVVHVLFFITPFENFIWKDKVDMWHVELLKSNQTCESHKPRLSTAGFKLPNLPRLFSQHSHNIDSNGCLKIVGFTSYLLCQLKCCTFSIVCHLLNIPFLNWHMVFL